MTEPQGVNIDANRVIDRLGRRIAELEIQVAQQAAVITTLMEQQMDDMSAKSDGAE